MTVLRAGDRLPVGEKWGLNFLCPAQRSRVAVKIAQASNVSAHWLATGEGPTMDREEVSLEPKAIGLVWSPRKGEAKDRFSVELLSVALPFLPASHPFYNVSDRIYRDASKRRHAKEELRDT